VSSSQKDPELFVAPGLGIIHPNGDYNAWQEDDLDVVLSFNEMITRAIRGDFDQFHSFVPSGHRIVWIERTGVDGSDAVFRVPRLRCEGYYRTTEMWIAGLGVVGLPDSVAGVVRGRFVERTSPDRQHLFERADPSRENALSLGAEDEAAGLLLPSGPEGPGTPLAHLWRVDEIRMQCSSSEAAHGLRAIAVLNATPELILDTLRDLDERWNVRFSLITEHSGYCFLNEKSLQFHSRRI